MDKRYKGVMRIVNLRRTENTMAQRGNENRKSKKNRKHNGQKIPKG